MDAFEKLLLNYKNNKFLVIDPPGEKGDYLIFLGLEKKLNMLNIDHEIIHYKINSSFSEHVATISRILTRSGLESAEKMLNKLLSPICTVMNKKTNMIRNASFDVILLRGGGYLNDLWKDYGILDSVLDALRGNPKAILIISPQSFFFTNTNFSEIFRNLNHEVHIFCREKYSFNSLSGQNFPENVHIHMSPDTALYLKLEDFVIEDTGKKHILISPRTDIESVTDWQINPEPEKRILVGDAIKVRTFTSFVNLIGNANQVYTDRIHVAVFSAILGKETYLYPNSYYKNKGIYEYSLVNFKHVKFVDSREFLGLENSISK